MSVVASPPVDLDLVAACEQRIINAWPAPTTLLIGDWVVRMANGYSGRANSASPLREGADLDETELALIERLYREAGLPPFVRITPLAKAGLEERLVQRGYELVGRSHGMVAALPHPGAREPDGLHMVPQATDAWIAAVSALQTPDKRNGAHLAAIVKRVQMDAGFATLSDAGRPVALGMSVVERGMAEIGSIIVDEADRGKGLGRRLVAGLLAWAAGRGAALAYLQVEEGNSRAISLYASFGFRPVYRYAGWRLPS